LAQRRGLTPPASNVSERRRSGLFETLLGDPRVLYQEMLEDPSRFDAEVTELVLRLVAGATNLESLTSEEREVLDRAVLDWASPRHSSRGPSPSSTPTSSGLPEEVERPYAELLEDSDVELEYREGGPPVPISLAPEMPHDPVPTFWWRQ
jgi:hypothetical protein